MEDILKNPLAGKSIEGQVVHSLDFSLDTRLPPDALPIVKTVIKEVEPKVAFVLDNVLSKSECLYLINRGNELGFHQVPGYNQKYRSQDRILVNSVSLSIVVYKRILPFIPNHISTNEGTNSSYASNYLAAPKGEWDINSCNDLWRLCKYGPGGKFLSHYDGIYVKDTYNRSFFTFMIYLNDVPVSGATRFLDKNCDTAKVKIQPKAGSVLVFQHDIWHDGEILNDGEKYIIRSDIMYCKRDDKRDEDSIRKEREARLILNEAIEMEKSDPAKSISLYKKAFALYPPLEKIA
ncbi:hypothetical protein CYY_008182 [Polysphondylium violaceum]|uniref:Prolyl 4-hydroxylase alpha subunit domain-containing protein n=1 Tax=Polysphondylium violaceum TaxID=133409 RepID=A0A8J4V490_9MYCE|nr:hypothetical protein CYY_008182 [Polysphondylium violaceum]